MTLPKENLDNKAFEDLLKEAISRIPVYAPGWTDHNLHDPGITFIELFAWLTEMQIYRLNRINDKNYRKFLKLIGIPKLKPASAAKVDVTFSLSEIANANLPVKVPFGTIVAATDLATGEDVLFETEQTLTVVKNTELIILSQSAKESDSPTDAPENYIDNTEANLNDNLFYYAFRQEKQPGNKDKFYIGFKDNPFKDNPDKEIVLAFYLANDEPLKKEENSFFIPSRILIWKYWGADGWTEIKEDGVKDETEDWIIDETKHLTASGKVRIKIANDLKERNIVETSGFWLQCCVMDEGYYHIPPKIDCILLNTVSAIHAVKRDDPKENTFSSSGLPDFYIDLKYAPMLDNTLTVNESELWNEVENFDASKPGDRHYTVDLVSGRVTFGDGINGKIPLKGTDNITISYNSGGCVHNDKFSSTGLPDFSMSLKYAPELANKLTVNVKELWTEVEDFDASKPEDRHFIVDLASGRVTFGNGINGKIPPKGTDKIKFCYHSGGGMRGNVKANSIKRILSESSESILDKVTVTNKKAASGGTEAETLEEAIQRARKELKTVTRAVTSADYEYLILNTPGLRVARAKALPKYHPNKDREVPGIISIIVVPESISEKPTPSPSFLKTVFMYLDEHRLLTTELFVLPPVYVEVSVEAKVVVKPKSLRDQVEKDVVTKLQKFLHPVSGGSDGKGWPFGRPVYLSEIYELIDGVEGVNYVENVALSGKRKTQKESIDIPLTATRSITIPSEGLVYLDLENTEIVAKEETDVFGV